MLAYPDVEQPDGIGASSPSRTFNISAKVDVDAFKRANAVGRKSRPALNGGAAFEQALTTVTPDVRAKRRIVSWNGMTADVVQTTSRAPMEYWYRGPMHLLVLIEQASRSDGVTQAGELTSSLRDMTRKLTFMPTGWEYRDRHHPRTATRMIFFYLDPLALEASQPESSGVDLKPRLFFEDAMLLSTAQKLASLIEGSEADNHAYLQALGQVLAHELFRLHQTPMQVRRSFKGGLAPWQQKVVATYVDEHLAEPIPLNMLAGLVQLSTFHFCRAFKQSFGLPPHRYHTGRRIEHAKALLAARLSVTEVGLRVGFSETSSFTAAFRKATGITPTAYMRSLA